MSHTPEPWIIASHDEGFGVAKPTDDGNYWVSDMIPHQPDGATEEANARRIVACVNACAAYSTEELEKHPAPIITKLLNERDVAEKQRDELIGPLSAARAWISDAPHGDDCFVSDHYEGDPGAQCNCGKDSMLSAIDAAITNATKEKP